MSQPVRIEIILDDRLTRGVRNASRGVDDLGKSAKKADKEMEALGKTSDAVSGAVKKLVGAFALKEVVSKIAAVRGEFQQLEVAFRTMLGSASQADTLMQQLVRTAATTPFGLEDVANGAKQLLAYGFEAEKVNETLVRLGDIAAGLSVPLNDLVYLYGTTMAQGRLYTQDLNQFTGRGIPMISELAKQFGVAESKVKELVEAGKVGFPEVQKVIEGLTDEGGKFGGLMEAQSKTITGQISNIEDAITMMFNEIGQQSEGVINTTLSAVSHVVENYQRFGRILLGVVATYGTYRAAVMAVAAAKGWATAAEALHFNWLLLVEKAQKMLNATMLANPYVLVATLIAGVVAAMVSMKSEAERMKEADEDYEAQKQKVIEAEEEHKRRLDDLCSVAGDEALSTDTRREALNKLEQKYPDIFAKYDTEYEKLKNIKKIKEEIAELDGKKSITRPENELAGVEKRIAELQSILNMKWTETKWEYNDQALRWERKTVQRRGQLSSDQQAEYKMLLKKRGGLNAQIRKNEVNAYFENLTGVSNETLASEIRLRENLLARMTTQQKKYGKINYGDEKLKGTYSRDDLQYQLNKLRSEQNLRNKPKDSSSDWVQGAKKEYQDALRDYNDFIHSTTNDLTQEEFEQRAKELKDAAELAKKEYDKLKPGEDKDSDRPSRQAEKERKAAERRLETERKLGQELVTLQNENDQAEIDAKEDGLQKKLRQIENDYSQQQAKIEKLRGDWKRDNAKAGRGDTLNQEQTDALAEAERLNDEKRSRLIAQAYRDEFALMQESLHQYGTYQQQKLAITSEYADKIRKATSEAQRTSLEMERDSQLASVKGRELQADVDWGVVFGEFGSMFQKIITPVLADAKAYMETDEFKNADHDSQQAVVQAVQEMEKAVGGANKVSFTKLGREVDDYLSKQEELKHAQEEYRKTFEALDRAQQEYAKAQASGTDAQREAADQALTTAQENEEAAGKRVAAMQRETDAARQTMTTNAADLKSAMEGVVGGLQKLASGSLTGAYNGLIELGNGAKKIGGKIGDAFGKIADTLSDLPILGWIVEIIDVFKDGLSVVLKGLLDAVFNAVGGILKDVLSGDFLVSIFDSVKNGIGNIFNAITFGGFNSWFSSSNAKQVKETIDSLTDRNKALQQSIEDLTDEIKASRGTKSVSAYNQAYKNQKEAIANYLGIAKAQAGYHSAHHSWNYYWGGFKNDELSWIRENIRSSFNGDLWSLSPEEMKKLRGNVGIWQRIQGTGKGGYGSRLTDKLDDYIDQAGKLEELTDQLYEGLTGISFDGMYDSFISNLMDMKYDAQQAADDISEYFMRAMLSNKIGEMYGEKLKGWWEKFGKAMEDNNLTEEERNALSEEYMKYVEEAMKLRDELAAATGYDPDKSSGSSQSGRAGGFNAMSQEQGTKLEGLFTSVAMHTASMDERMEDVAERIGMAGDHLRKIEENTGRAAARLDEVGEDIKKIIRDGVKTR